MLHGEVHVACPTELALPTLFLSFISSTSQSLQDQILSTVVPPPSCAKFRKETAMLQKPSTFLTCFLLLSFVGPIRVAESEIGLTSQSQQGDFEENRVHP